MDSNCGEGIDSPEVSGVFQAVRGIEDGEGEYTHKTAELTKKRPLKSLSVLPESRYTG
jgi:hypothetical protein